MDLSQLCLSGSGTKIWGRYSRQKEGQRWGGEFQREGGQKPEIGKFWAVGQKRVQLLLRFFSRIQKGLRMQGIQTRATPCNRPVKKRAKKKGAGSGGSEYKIKL